MTAYCGVLLRVDLASGRISREPIDPAVARKFIGGRGLGTCYLRQEVAPTAEPLRPENKLFIASGPLTGTAVPAAGRYMVVTKSPLSGTVASSNAGGFWGPELKAAGFDMIALEGRAPKPVYLAIHDGQAELRDASGLWGSLVSESTRALVQESGDPEARVLSIGPAGEKLSLIASIMSDKYRAAGRSGVGAVMGSKNLKAIVVRGTQPVQPARPGDAKEAIARAQRKLRECDVTAKGLPTYGTAVLVNVINESGCYPTENFQKSVFPAADQVSGEALAERYLVKNTACYRCPMACGRRCALNGEEGEGPEYETLWALSADCGVSDLEAVIRANNLCNEYGLDDRADAHRRRADLESRADVQPGRRDRPLAGPPSQTPVGGACARRAFQRACPPPARTPAAILPRARLGRTRHSHARQALRPGAGMKIEVRLFATLRVGRFAKQPVQLPEGSHLADVLAPLALGRHEVSIRLVNGRIAEWDNPLADGDTVSLFAPVGGG